MSQHGRSKEIAGGLMKFEIFKGNHKAKMLIRILKGWPGN